jgi:prolyl-tRNA synthetase
VQAVVVPIFRKNKEKAEVFEAAGRLKAEIEKADIRVELDDREGKRPGEKFYEWERKGVPIRIELGPRDIASGEVMSRLRVSEGKEKRPLATLADDLGGVLDGFQKTLFERALSFRAENTVTIDTWADFTDVFKEGASKFVWAHWDGTNETEATIKEETKATVRLIPLQGQGPAPEPGACVKTGKPSAQRALFAKAY